MLIAAGAVALISILLLFRDDTTEMDRSQDREIGRIVEMRNDVRKRPANSLTWAQVQPNDVIYQGESILTGENSTLQLDLSDRGEVFIEPQSLIVFRDAGQSVNLDLQSGRALVHIPKDAGLSIQRDSEVFRVQGKNKETRIRIEHEDKTSLVIEALTGEIETRVAARLHQVKNGQSLRIGKDEKVDLRDRRLELKSPDQGKTVWLAADESVSFSWADQKNEGPYRIQIATDRDFGSLIVDESTMAKSFVAKVPLDRVLFWRITPANSPEESESASLTAVTRSAPEPLHPTNQLTMNTLDDTLLTDFSWTPKLGTNKYELQISTSPEFAQVDYRATPQGATAQVQLKTDQKYHWRVRALSPAPVADLWSPTWQFSLMSQPPVAVAVSEPPNEKELSFESDQLTVQLKWDGPRLISPPVLSWSLLKEHEAYSLSISEHEDLSRPLVDRVIRSNRFQWLEARPGRFFARLQPIGNKTVSARMILELRSPPPVLEPETVIRLRAKSIETLDQTREVNIRWSPLPKLALYQIEISRENLFKVDVHQLESNDPSVRWTVKPNEVYFLRVRGMARRGQPASEYSNVARIRTVGELDLSTPLVVQPAANVIVPVNNNQGKAVVFVWQSVPLADRYELRLLASPQSSEALFQTETHQTDFVWRPPSKYSDLYWQVRSKFKTHVSVWSEPRRLSFDRPQ